MRSFTDILGVAITIVQNLVHQFSLDTLIRFVYLLIHISMITLNFKITSSIIVTIPMNGNIMADVWPKVTEKTQK